MLKTRPRCYPRPMRREPWTRTVTIRGIQNEELTRVCGMVKLDSAEGIVKSGSNWLLEVSIPSSSAKKKGLEVLSSSAFENDWGWWAAGCSKAKAMFIAPAPKSMARLFVSVLNPKPAMCDYSLSAWMMGSINVIETRGEGRVCVGVASVDCLVDDQKSILSRNCSESRE